MKGKIRNMLLIMLAAIVPLAFTSCELDGPLSHFKIVVNDRLDYLPMENILEIEAMNKELSSVPYEKDDAIKCFDKVCDSLQGYYDEHRGALIWDNLDFEVCLYNTTNGKGTGEGQLVKSRVITYRCE